MGVKVLEIKKESCPACRLIGKKYEGNANWGEWWENNWFEILEQNQSLPFNGDAYIGAVRIADGMPQRWIGMFFPANTEVPEGFEVIVLPKCKYVMFHGEPFEEADFGEAIQQIWDAAKKYNPEVVGLCWDDTNPRIQLEPIGTRGYIELYPVKDI